MSLPSSSAEEPTVKAPAVEEPTAEDLSLARPLAPEGASASEGPPPLTTPPLPSSVGPGVSADARRHRRLSKVVATILIVAGLLLLADAGVTLVWQEPISALYAHFKQESLGKDLQALDHATPTPEARQALARLHEERRRVAYLAGALQRHAKAGSAVGRIRIPAIGASFVMVKGTGTSELENGPGIYPETSFPGVPGTTAIAGHRTTYLAPFRHIDALHKGESILLEMPYARLLYRVIGSRVVLPTDVSVLDPVGYSRLILSACTPLFSASHRLIVFARLESTTPLGAALARSEGAHGEEPFGEEHTGLPLVLKARQRLLAPLVS
jgi:sortase A